MTAVSDSSATQGWTTTQGYSTGVDVSVEVGASFFEIFSASMSVGFSFEQSQSYSETYTFDASGRCEPNQRAVVYFYPLFDEYVGAFSDRPSEEVVFHIPVQSEFNFEIRAECLG